MVLFKESFSGHKWEAMLSEQNQEAFSSYCLLYKGGTRGSDKNIFHFQGSIHRQGPSLGPKRTLADF